MLIISSYLSCGFLEMEARLTGVLAWPKAYKEFCKDLYQIGVTSEMISQNEEEILNMFHLPNFEASGVRPGSDHAAARRPVEAVSYFFPILVDNNILT